MNKEKEDICYGGLKGYGKTYCEMIRLQQENNQLKEQKKELRSWLEEMLDNENDIFSVVRVKDILSKLNELEGVNNDK